MLLLIILALFAITFITVLFALYVIALGNMQSIPLWKRRIVFLIIPAVSMSTAIVLIIMAILRRL